VCTLTAGLTTNRDTLYSGYQATFSATPSGQTNYKFYVNNVLKQNSSAAIFKTHTLVYGDSVKVVVKNVDLCESTAKKAVRVRSAPSIVEPVFNDTIALFAGDSITVDTSTSVFGSVRATNFISSGIYHIIGTTTAGVDAINTALTNQTDSLYNVYSANGGWLRENDSVQVFSNPGQYHLIGNQVLTSVSFVGDSNSVYIVYVEGLL
jgi:hypothetical protein